MNSWELVKDKNEGRVLVLGHRGSPLRERENTLKSFKRAIEEGADGVELDVHPTLDNHLVVSHDSIINISGYFEECNIYFFVIFSWLDSVCPLGLWGSKDIQR